MMYFVIIFASPLYFLARKKWLAFVGNSFLYFISFPLLLLGGFGVITWAMAVGHAGWHLRMELMREQAKVIAEEMVRKMDSKTTS